YSSVRLGDGEATLAGEVHQNEKLVLLEDVTSSGTHASRAVKALRSAGADVDSVLGVIDRSEGATELLSREGIELSSLYTIDELSTKPMIQRSSVDEYVGEGTQ